jgi:protein-L-isoaspartate(D-aspartate) O-methyltransferase
MTSDRAFGMKSLKQIQNAGAVFRIVRRGEEYLAHRISGNAIFPCAGARDEVSERALAEAFVKGGSDRVTRLYRNQELPAECCWLRGSGWCLAYS